MRVVVTMKNVRLLLDGKWIKDYVKGELNLYLFDGATVLYALAKVDWIIRRRFGKFPIKEFESLLHMLYNPLKGCFYEQVVMHASSNSEFLPARNNPFLNLLDNTKIHLLLWAECGTIEPVLSPREFHEKASCDENLRNALKIHYPNVKT